MKVINALHMTCDMLLFFTVAAMFAPFADAQLLIAAALLAVFASTLLVQQKDILPMRILCGLIPFAALFAAKNNAQLIATGIMLLILFVVGLFGGFNMKYEDSRLRFGIPAFLVCALIAVCIGMNAFTYRTTIILGCLYLILGVFVLRRKRMGRADAEAKLLSAAELGGALAVCTAASVLVYFLLAGSASLARLLIRSFRRLSNTVMELVDEISYLITGGSQTPQINEQELGNNAGVIGSQGAGNSSGFFTKPWVRTIGKGLEILLALALIALAVYLIVRWIKALRKNGGSDEDLFGEDGADIERLPSGAKKSKRKRRKEARNSNSAKVRTIYRDYLALAKKHGIEIVRRTTSADVLDASKQIKGDEEDEALRAIYIRARYSDPDGISSEDVQKAEELWKTIKERIEGGSRL